MIAPATPVFSHSEIVAWLHSINEHYAKLFQVMLPGFSAAELRLISEAKWDKIISQVHSIPEQFWAAALWEVLAKHSLVTPGKKKYIDDDRSRRKRKPLPRNKADLAVKRKHAQLSGSSLSQHTKKLAKTLDLAGLTAEVTAANALADAKNNGMESLLLRLYELTRPGSHGGVTGPGGNTAASVAATTAATVHAAAKLANQTGPTNSLNSSTHSAPPPNAPTQ